jgi:cobalt/nickel transport system permease protein
LPFSAVFGCLCYFWYFCLFAGTECLIFLTSRLPFPYLAERFRLPGLFLLMLAIILPFFSGQTVLLQIGVLSLKQEGCLQVLMIVAKFVSILTAGIVLFATTPFHRQIKAMQALGLPPLFTDMILFTYRFIFEMAEKLRTMKTAMKLRDCGTGG